MLYQRCLVSWKNKVVKVATIKCSKGNFWIQNPTFFFVQCAIIFFLTLFLLIQSENLNVANNAKCKAFGEKWICFKVHLNYISFDFFFVIFLVFLCWNLFSILLLVIFFNAFHSKIVPNLIIDLSLKVKLA
jgi:hypothetical protein